MLKFINDFFSWLINLFSSKEKPSKSQENIAYLNKSDNSVRIIPTNQISIKKLTKYRDRKEWNKIHNSLAYVKEQKKQNYLANKAKYYESKKKKRILDRECKNNLNNLRKEKKNIR